MNGLAFANCSANSASITQARTMLLGTGEFALRKARIFQSSCELIGDHPGTHNHICLRPSRLKKRARAFARALLPVPLPCVDQ